MPTEIKTLAGVPSSFFVNDLSQDIANTREHNPTIPDDATVVAVNIKDGDYTEVYYGDSSRPYLPDTPMIKVK